jgi:hypothetical protein
MAKALATLCGIESFLPGGTRFVLDYMLAGGRPT